MRPALLGGVLDDLPPVGLDELVALAELQTRTDRKYVVTADQLDTALAAMSQPARILEIDGRRSFSYDTLYFDTPELASFFGAARGRPERFKVRVRTYVESGDCTVEVKLRNRRGQTVKHRLAHDGDHAGALSSGAVAFVREFPSVGPHADALIPMATTTYRRTTILLDGRDRATVDRDVSCRVDLSRQVGFGQNLIVETKSVQAPSPLDRAFWSTHVRPTAISKYCTGLAALFPDLPGNRWHRALSRGIVQPVG